MAGLGVLAGLLLASAAAPAFAHDELLGTDPAIDSVQETLPPELELTFSGVLLTGDGATEVVVTDAAGNDLTEGDPVLDGVRVTQALSGTASGEVHVAWRVVSSDGHPISGEYSFQVGDGAAATDDGTPPATAIPGEDTADGDLLPVWIIIGVVILIGGVVVVFATRSRGSRED